ncbi:3-oxoacyl-reductase [Abortiporus biennis]|nr:3-oxoacyl-reductase [Abortiporus biennis]
MSQQTLQGKLALVTGATGGIGHASAKALAQLGANIAVHHSSDASKPKADSIVSELKSLYPNIKAAAFKADLSEYSGVDALHKEVVETLGHPDIVFANHGALFQMIGPAGNIADVSIEVVEKSWRLHTGASYRLVQLCIPHMEAQKWGRIIFTSSVAATVGGSIGPHYASSKSALHGLIHWIASRYAKLGITSNGIAPALIEETKMIPAGNDVLRSQIPIGRLGKPDEIASIVALLATNQYMTNKVIGIDGGWTVGAI